MRLFDFLNKKRDSGINIRTLIIYFSVFLVCILLVIFAVNGSFSSKTGTAKVSNAVYHSRIDTKDEVVTESTEPTVSDLTDRQKAALKIEDIKKKDKTRDSVKLDVPEIIQYPELPTGCESVSLTIALNSLGEKLEKTDIAEKYLIISDDVNTGFVGNPFDYGGAGIYPEGLTETAWVYIKDKNADLGAASLLGDSFDTVLKVVDSGIPVVIWTTSYYGPVMDYEDDFYLNEHCVVLYGYDKDEGLVYLSDPETGYNTCDIDQFEGIYNETGKMAMAVFSLEEV